MDPASGMAGMGPKLTF